jgi:Family of unknown function (DUF6159)
MFERIRRSWELVKASYGVLRSDKELIVFPIISFFGVILVTIAFAIPLLGTGILDSATRVGSSNASPFGAVHVIILFLFYMVMYTVIIFSQTALIGAAMIRLGGGDPTLADGFRIASEHFSTILGYAVICATVGMILNALSSSARSNRNIAGRIIAELVISIIGIAWNLATFLAVPVLVIENVGPIEAVKRSAGLLKKTWGEQIVGSFGIGTVFGLLTFAVILVGIVLIALFASINASALVLLTIMVMVVGVLALSLLSSALSGIYQAVVYRYATQGEVGGAFPRELVEGAFKPKQQRSGILG